MKCGNQVILCIWATLAFAVWPMSNSEAPVTYYYYPVPRVKHFHDSPERQPARSNYGTRSRPEQHFFSQQHVADRHRNHVLHRQHAAHLPPPNKRVVQLFVAPSLEEAAFRKALISQGYAANAGDQNFRTTVDTRSLNVKLPLPFGLTPLRNPPLPLQEGASFASLPRAVTSYGTTHPVRR